MLVDHQSLLQDVIQIDSHNCIRFYPLQDLTHVHSSHFLAMGRNYILLPRNAVLPMPFNLFGEDVLHLVTTPRLDVSIKEDVNLLERATCGLRVCEEDVHGHHSTENAEDDVRPPLNVVEGRCDKVRDRKVENPISSRRDSNTLCTIFQGEDF